MPFYLWKRGDVYYYRLQGEKTFHSTGIGNKRKAEAMVFERIGLGNPVEVTLREYSKPFFIWETCPHARRRRDERKTISRRHLKSQRAWLEKYILTNHIADKIISEISRGEIIDFRSRLMGNVGDNTLNKVMETIKVVFNEALYREDIKTSPVQGIGAIKYQKKEAGIFTPTELSTLFPDESLGPWQDLRDYTCFLFAATVGMTRQELLVLKWRHISFNNMSVRIEDAWKGGDEVGVPKWGRVRTAPLTEKAVQALNRLREDSLHTDPDDYIFCYDDGSRMKETWWRKRFITAIDSTGIDRTSRNLKPHSFRHSLNTFLLDSGFDPEKVRAILGWTNRRTQRIYTHWKIEHLREQASSIDNLFQ